ncbi:nuclear transport factor 2 family protein [Streptomyces bacillaris]|uniref:nuclear transport factor 2 family protein n=1 Tax=Streptomyces bacillaris TaxID=68179 RepID=UPI00382F06F0
MTTSDDIDLLHTRIQRLADRVEVTEVCDRYVTHLDRSRHEDTWFGSVFTEDVHLAFPFGEYKGFEGLASFQEMTRTTFERTYHLAGNYEVELYPGEDRNRARVRAHLMAVHVRRREEPGEHFDIGGHYEADFVRTGAGWRIRGFAFDLVWNTGQGPAAGH